MIVPAAIDAVETAEIETADTSETLVMRPGVSLNIDFNGCVYAIAGGFLAL